MKNKPAQIKALIKIMQIALQPANTQFIRLPKDTEPLAVKNINGKIVLIAIINVNEKIEDEYRIDINSVGRPITFPSESRYLGTFTLPAPEGQKFVLSAFIIKASRIVIASRIPDELIKA